MKYSNVWEFKRIGQACSLLHIEMNEAVRGFGQPHAHFASDNIVDDVSLNDRRNADSFFELIGYND